MKALYQCAKIVRSLQNETIIRFGLIMFLFQSLNVFNLPVATKNLITNYTFFLNSFVAEVVIIYKLVHSFAEQLSGLVSL